MSAIQPGDAKLVLRQTRYEQTTFWRNRIAAAFTLGFSTVFLVLVASGGGNQRLKELGNIPQIQYYAPGFVAYGVMSACFNNFAIALVNRRERGLLKRIRLSPLPAWAMMAAMILSSVIVAIVGVVIVLSIGRLGYDLRLPSNELALVVAIIVGAVAFTAVGAAASTFIPNQDAAGPVLGIVFFVLLFLSGLWFPISNDSGLARVSSFFPIRHMIVAVFAPFDQRPGISPWAWNDIGILALWGVIGAVIALRRWEWAPRRK